MPKDHKLTTITPLSCVVAFIAAVVTATAAIGQEPCESFRAGGLEWVFASLEQGREALRREDEFVKRLSPFDRQARMHAETDPGTQALLKFVSDQVIEWPMQDRAAVRAAILSLDEQLADVPLPDVGPVMLVHTTGREESGACYTRGSAIIIPQGKAGSLEKPPRRLIAHELFHVLSRSDDRWRDRLYSIIGFSPTNEIDFPGYLADRRMTNPDAPQIAHVIKIDLGDQQTATVAPVLIAKSEYDPRQRSFFRYLDFQLMEVIQIVGKKWIPKAVDEKAVLHAPSNPDFHRQIGGNTSYILHPEEILAVNFALLMTDAKVKDQWILDEMQTAFAVDQKSDDNGSAERSR